MGFERKGNGRGTNKRNDDGDASSAETSDESPDVHHI
jgi:hypothetical protein